MSYPFEPFKFKAVEPIQSVSKRERTKLLRDASYNLFKIPADRVTIDLLTDSGTGALSQEQWSRSMLGDESYAAAKSWKRLEESAQKFSGKRYILPVHQGRAAEKIIAEVFLTKNDVVLANTLFDTTRANFEYQNASCVDIPARKAADLTKPTQFKGDMDLIKLRTTLKKYKKRTKLIVMTLTNNSGGGQPASFKNIEAVSKIARGAGVPFLIDACRIAENAYFIYRDEFKNRGSIGAIVKKTLALADFAHMSAKKDGLANIGGFIVTGDKKLAENLGNLVVLYEGYLTYGGMSGRDMEIISCGLEEVVDKNYMEYRINQTKYLHNALAEIGVPLVHPAGGHAVYINAENLLPHIPKNEFPAQALATALYLEGGIRSVEIGSLMFGGVAKNELVRLALPRRTYTQSHLDYVAEVCRKIFQNRKKLRGFKIVWEPEILRHFSCRLEPIK